MNLERIAAEFGTPAYVYDLAAVRTAHADLRQALPAGAFVYYSLKANPHPRLVAEFANLGCGAEVSSPGEVEVAVGAGVDPGAILLTGPGKTAQTIAHALDHGVRRFSVDSPHDLARVGGLAASRGTPVRCLLRVNADEPVPGMGLAMTGTASQFGADLSWVTGQPELFRRCGAAEVTGLHLYMGTNIEDGQTLLRQFETAAIVAAALGGPLGDPVEVNLGGGFGAPYAREGRRRRFPALADRLSALLDTHLPAWRAGKPRVAFESGRYLVGDCGVLVCKVVDVKTSKGQPFAVLDAGVNHLGGMAGLRRLPPILPTIRPLAAGGGAAAPPTPTAAGAGLAPAVPTAVVGPLCTPLDTFARSACLPPLEAGQLLAIPNVGAYGLTASLVAFLSHPAPVEVVMDGEEVVTASRLGLTRTETAAPARAHVVTNVL
jgi:diaminopimelate decarboxylase